MSYNYSFDARRDDIGDLMYRANRANISFTLGGLIRIKRRAWAKGKRTGMVVQVYKEYPSALRSLRHIIQNTFARAGLDRSIRFEFSNFHSWLLSSSSNAERKRDEAEARLLRLAERLSGVRTENLVRLRTGLLGGDLKKSIQELIEAKGWGAACTKIVFRLNPAIVVEHRRVLEYVPAILYQEEVLGKIWDFRLQQAYALRKDTIEFAKLYDRVETAKSRVGELLTNLDAILAGFEKPPHYRVLNAGKDLRSTRKALARGYKSKTATGERKSAQYLLRGYYEWVLAGETDVEPSRQRVMQFEGVA